MKCLHPVTIRNPRYEVSNIREPTHIYVPCGKCEACIQSRSSEWRIRLENEQRFSFSGIFLTLTYEDSKLPFERVSDSFGNSHIVPSVSKRDVQLFFKRLRVHYERHENWTLPIRYFLCSEYGPLHLRPHYHAVVFNLPFSVNSSERDIVKIWSSVQECWSNGFVKIDPINSHRIAYVTKYVTMAAANLPEYLPKPFFLMSRRPGLGECYLQRDDVADWHRQNLISYYPNGKFKCKLPRYYKDKLFDDDMKEIIHDHTDFDSLLERNICEARFFSPDAPSDLHALVDLEQNGRANFLRDFNRKFLKRKDL